MFEMRGLARSSQSNTELPATNICTTYQSLDSSLILLCMFQAVCTRNHEGQEKRYFDSIRRGKHCGVFVCWFFYVCPRGEGKL